MNEGRLATRTGQADPHAWVRRSAPEEKPALIPSFRSFPFCFASDLVIDHLFCDSFCHIHVALTGETISTLPDIYHEISVALPVSGSTELAPKVLGNPQTSPSTLGLAST